MKHLVACSKSLNSSGSRSCLASCEVARTLTLSISLKCCCEKSTRFFAKKIIIKLDLNINVKCHVNVEHEGSPWGIPLDFGWYGPMLPGDTRIYQILWIIFQLDTCMFRRSLPKPMSISRSRILRTGISWDLEVLVVEIRCFPHCPRSRMARVLCCHLQFNLSFTCPMRI